MKNALFVLTMPCVNTWNGRWTGEGCFYAHVEKVHEHTANDISDQSYDYDFGDGWMARIDVKIVDSKDAKNAKEKSEGFLGYKWMVNSIIQHKEIRVP